MPEPTPETIIASVAGLKSGLETMAQTARTLPAPVWGIVAELVEGQVHTLNGIQSLLEAVVEGGGTL